MIRSVSFSPVATPLLKISLINLNRPKSLKLHAHASLIDFPLASKIMVRNLSYSTSESRLLKEFSNFGQIAEVKLVKDEATKRSKGYAFIQYASQDNAMLALESMDHKHFDGRVIFVELAKPGNNSGGFLKTSGPPSMQNLPMQDDAKE
ncbi:small RNA-binding protein 11, chloroplastic [Cornus florida]|uniref:small RNA-binding protein 11, chloroplastic n=1 Tax=Cornus florida TaxID=4283 RepID=UPI00289F91A0|nr:small RNA-binding protein 11, chloroplastic [Cornus florida]